MVTMVISAVMLELYLTFTTLRYLAQKWNRKGKKYPWQKGEMGALSSCIKQNQKKKKKTKQWSVEPAKSKVKNKLRGTAVLTNTDEWVFISDISSSFSTSVQVKTFFLKVNRNKKSVYKTKYNRSSSTQTLTTSKTSNKKFQIRFPQSLVSFSSYSFTNSQVLAEVVSSERSISSAGSFLIVSQWTEGVVNQSMN